VTWVTDSFIAHRNLLFTVAYEMLGSAADAEDVLQETWLRWSGVEHATVRDPRAFLVRVTTRQSPTRLRTLRRRKESCIGPWLPEPLLIALDVAEDVELADSVSMAMFLVLETLAPTEHAVFVLRDVFGLDYGEIAQAVDKPPPVVRQIAHRARAHVAAPRRRGPAQGPSRGREPGLRTPALTMFVVTGHRGTDVPRGRSTRTRPQKRNLRRGVAARPLPPGPSSALPAVLQPSAEACRSRRPLGGSWRLLSLSRAPAPEAAHQGHSHPGEGWQGATGSRTRDFDPHLPWISSASTFGAFRRRKGA
jgi:RNA polymerase sigma factor (sigma-70 family)